MDEILRLPHEDAILILRGWKPLKLKKMDYTKHPEAKKLVVREISEYKPSWAQEIDLLERTEGDAGKTFGSEAQEAPGEVLEMRTPRRSSRSRGRRRSGGIEVMRRPLAGQAVRLSLGQERCLTGKSGKSGGGEILVEGESRFKAGLLHDGEGDGTGERECLISEFPQEFHGLPCDIGVGVDQANLQGRSYLLPPSQCHVNPAVQTQQYTGFGNYQVCGNELLVLLHGCSVKGCWRNVVLITAVHHGYPRRSINK